VQLRTRDAGEARGRVREHESEEWVEIAIDHEIAIRECGIIRTLANI
jgi:hypothetical protein